MNSESPTFNEKENKIQSKNVRDKSTKAVVQPTPTPAKKEVLIVIDPGHGGDDLGTYYGNIYEKKLNLIDYRANVYAIMFFFPGST